MEQNVFARVSNYLVKNNITISFMESCTGGLLASLLTDTEGVSAIFCGSLVTYSNAEKIKNGVSAEVIDKYSVYSGECAKEMASAVSKRYLTDISVGITGTTGNIDPNNTSGAAGEAFYCIIFNDSCYEEHIRLDVSGYLRQNIKMAYAEEVYKSLAHILGC